EFLQGLQSSDNVALELLRRALFRGVDDRFEMDNVDKVVHPVDDEDQRGQPMTSADHGQLVVDLLDGGAGYDQRSRVADAGGKSPLLFLVRTVVLGPGPVLPANGFMLVPVRVVSAPVLTRAGVRAPVTVRPRFGLL